MVWGRVPRHLGHPDLISVQFRTNWAEYLRDKHRKRQFVHKMLLHNFGAP